MVTNYYNASNNFSYPVRHEPKPYTPKDTCKVCENPKKENTPSSPLALNSLDKDTILILGLIFLLVMSGCDDTLLLIALGAIIFL